MTPDLRPGARLSVEGTYNLRDVGGYPLVGGGRTRTGVLYRSDALAALTDTGRRALAGLGLARILDLRSDPEIRTAPSSLGDLDVPVQQVSVLKAAAPSEQQGARHTLDEIYRLMVERRGRHLVTAVRSVVGAGGPVLVHCTAGKDRTGVVVALALDAAGVERETVVDDYAATERHLAGEWTTRMLTRISAGWQIPDEDIRAIVTTSPAPVMARLLAHVNETYGGSAGYLRAQGMAERELEQLRERLTLAG